MDLCTVISERFIPQALNLIQSYRVHSYDHNIYVYYFNTNREKLNIFVELFGDRVKLIEVQNVCEHALSPRVFFYKVYAIRDCLLNHSNGFIYSDSANCFVREAKDIHNHLIDDSLFLSYPYEGLTNKYWTTKACFTTINAPGADFMPQYWAGFQVYRKTQININFVNELYDYMLLPAVALPDTTTKKPDGSTEACIEHRQDQSALSLLIHKNNRHQFFNVEKNNLYGDWQTFVDFDNTYEHKFDKMVLSPRESKFGKFRFLNV
tara:strand:- start:4145 stop:4936 length:792 start_codon:yes stop_codon:yes gene_type:complete